MMRRVEWTDVALSDLRRMDRSQAVRVLDAVRRFVETGHGDVRRLEAYEREFRLRVGDWRVRFTERADGSLLVLRVLHRSVAYR